MRCTPWTLALLALSLPAPALSDPLRLPSITSASWHQTNGHGAATGAERSWRRQRAGLPVQSLDAGPALSRRQRNRDAWLDRHHDDGYGYDQGYGDGRADRDALSDRYGRMPARTEARRQWPGRPYPLAVMPAPSQPQRRCGPGPALVGAALGGGLGAALSDGSRQRQWALPIGATVGGLLGGVLAGC